jgi:glucan phosphoethanolaminetransferase (alkaline phosphatase superfamily)
MLTYIIELIYKHINKFGFTVNDLSIALNEGANFASDALVSYAESIKYALFIAFIVLMVILVLRKFIVKKEMFIKRKYVLVAFLLALFLSYSITYKTAGETQTRPTLMKTFNTVFYYLSNSLYYGKREKVNDKFVLAKDKSLKSYNNIIFIVDESIGGEYLSINGYEKETTPYLKSIEDKFINLGISSSAANCSASSNLIMMSGIQLNELPDKENRSLKKATIFQYAKKAGYKTHYISEQKIRLKYQNYMTEYDFQYIDTLTQRQEVYENKSMPEEAIVLKTAEILEKSEKNFIYIVKHGAHFQWEKSYPKSERYFLPTLETTDALSFDERDKALNTYLNAVRYNVDLFFKYFLKSINFFERDDTLIIYTSDHGQSILEKGRISTHCDSKNPPLSQGKVPLLIFTSKEDTFINNIKFEPNHYSNYELFPTLQKVMGYKEVTAKTLFDKRTKEDKQIFVSGNIFGWVALQENDINFK